MAVAVDDGLLLPFVVQHHAGEDGDDAGFAVGILAGAIDVGVAQDGVVQAVGALEELQVEFADALGEGVGA